MSKLFKSYILPFILFISVVQVVLACGNDHTSISSPESYLKNCKKFYFIRHGETDFNKQNKISGSSDITLNEEGKKQAEKAAAILKSYKIDVIVASPMIRTKQTAEIIAKTLHVPIIYNKDLREAGWGSFEGKNSKSPEVKEMLASWVKGEDVNKLTGAENKHDFQKRIAIALDGILLKYDNILIVSHGAVFGNLTDIFGMGYVKSDNAIPYEFIPTNDHKVKYKIKNLAEGK
jgi:broad specificity phosphatase PhoE